MTVLAGLVIVVALEQYTRVSVFNGALIAAGLMGDQVLLGRTGSQKRRLRRAARHRGRFGTRSRVKSTGLANTLSQRMLGILQPVGPWAALGGVYLLTLVFTEMVTNNAAAALVFPVAHAAARGLAVNYLPFMIAVAIAASAGFATPLGYETHLMVYGPGGYRFSDFVRIGVPLDLLVVALTLLLTPIIFPF